MESDVDTGVVVDRDYKEYWSARLQNPEEDMESMQIKEGNIVELGTPSTKKENTQFSILDFVHLLVYVWIIESSSIKTTGGFALSIRYKFSTKIHSGRADIVNKNSIFSLVVCFFQISYPTLTLIKNTIQISFNIECFILLTGSPIGVGDDEEGWGFEDE